MNIWFAQFLVSFSTFVIVRNQQIPQKWNQQQDFNKRSLRYPHKLSSKAEERKENGWTAQKSMEGTKRQVKWCNKIGWG